MAVEEYFNVDELYNEIFSVVYKKKLEELSRTEEENIRKNILTLRESYLEKEPISIYDNGEIRKAYMLCYYPNYSKIIYELMDKYIYNLVKNKSENFLSITFLAAGPGAEIFGFIKYLSDKNYKKTLRIIATDYEEGWKDERKLTFKLIKNITNLSINKIKNVVKCNLTLNCKLSCNLWNSCNKTVYKSDLIFMQNLLNHIGGNKEFYYNLQNKINLLKKGALFIIVDLDYNISKSIIKRLCEEKSVKVIGTNIYGDIEKSTITLEENHIINKKIFRDNLIRKKNSRYYYAILQKK